MREPGYLEGLARDLISATWVVIFVGILIFVVAMLFAS